MRNRKIPSTLIQLTQHVVQITSNTRPLETQAWNSNEEKFTFQVNEWQWNQARAKEVVELFEKYSSKTPELENILLNGILSDTKSTSKTDLPWSQQFTEFLCRLTPSTITKLRKLVSVNNLLPSPDEFEQNFYRYEADTQMYLLLFYSNSTASLLINSAKFIDHFVDNILPSIAKPSTLIKNPTPEQLFISVGSLQIALDANAGLNKFQCEDALTGLIQHLHRSDLININSEAFTKKMLQVLVNNYNQEGKQTHEWQALSDAWLNHSELENPEEVADKLMQTLPSMHSGDNIPSPAEKEEFCTRRDPDCKNPVPSNGASRSAPFPSINFLNQLLPLPQINNLRPSFSENVLANKAPVFFSRSQGNNLSFSQNIPAVLALLLLATLVLRLAAAITKQTATIVWNFHPKNLERTAANRDVLKIPAAARI
jgi:hypothetical protein